MIPTKEQMYAAFDAIREILPDCDFALVTVDHAGKYIDSHYIASTTTRDIQDSLIEYGQLLRDRQNTIDALIPGKC